MPVMRWDNVTMTCVTRYTQDGFNALHYATSAGHLICCRLILSNDNDINAQSNVSNCYHDNSGYYCVHVEWMYSIVCSGSEWIH